MMKAMYYRHYGAPEELQLTDIDRPEPKPNEVMVQVKSNSLNALDWHMMRGKPYFMRFLMGIGGPKNPVLGADVAGVVKEVGTHVTHFQPGDKVFGAMLTGGFAEYTCIEESKLAKMPQGVSFEEASAVPVAGVTALQAGRDAAQIKSGDHVLIHGASSGVGTFAVQLAKAWGAEVTTVTSTRNLELMRSLGADSTIDYTKEDFTTLGKTYDVILDIVGNKKVKALKRVLKPEGKGIVIGYTSMGMMMHISLFGNKKPRPGHPVIYTLTTEVNTKDLSTLRDLMEAGKIKSVIDLRFPFEDIPQALTYVESGRARGKVVASF